MDSLTTLPGETPSYGDPSTSPSVGPAPCSTREAGSEQQAAPLPGGAQLKQEGGGEPGQGSPPAQQGPPPEVPAGPFAACLAPLRPLLARRFGAVLSAALLLHGALAAEEPAGRGSGHALAWRATAAFLRALLPPAGVHRLSAAARGYAAVAVAAAAQRRAQAAGAPAARVAAPGAEPLQAAGRASRPAHPPARQQHPGGGGGPVLVGAARRKAAKPRSTQEAMAGLLPSRAVTASSGGRRGGGGGGAAAAPAGTAARALRPRRRHGLAGREGGWEEEGQSHPLAGRGATAARAGRRASPSAAVPLSEMPLPAEPLPRWGRQRARHASSDSPRATLPSLPLNNEQSLDVGAEGGVLSALGSLAQQVADHEQARQAGGPLAAENERLRRRLRGALDAQARLESRLRHMQQQLAAAHAAVAAGGGRRPRGADPAALERERLADQQALLAVEARRLAAERDALEKDRREFRLIVESLGQSLLPGAAKLAGGSAAAASALAGAARQLGAALPAGSATPGSLPPLGAQHTQPGYGGAAGQQEAAVAAVQHQPPLPGAASALQSVLQSLAAAQRPVPAAWPAAPTGAAGGAASSAFGPAPPQAAAQPFAAAAAQPPAWRPPLLASQPPPPLVVSQPAEPVRPPALAEQLAAAVSKLQQAQAGNPRLAELMKQLQGVIGGQAMAAGPQPPAAPPPPPPPAAPPPPEVALLQGLLSSGKVSVEGMAGAMAQLLTGSNAALQQQVAALLARLSQAAPAAGPAARPDLRQFLDAAAQKLLADFKARQTHQAQQASPPQGPGPAAAPPGLSPAPPAPALLAPAQAQPPAPGLLPAAQGAAQAPPLVQAAPVPAAAAAPPLPASIQAHIAQFPPAAQPALQAAVVKLSRGLQQGRLSAEQLVASLPVPPEGRQRLVAMLRELLSAQDGEGGDSAAAAAAPGPARGGSGGTPQVSPGAAADAAAAALGVGGQLPARSASLGQAPPAATSPVLQQVTADDVAPVHKQLPPIRTATPDAARRSPLQPQQQPAAAAAPAPAAAGDKRKTPEPAAGDGGGDAADAASEQPAKQQRVAGPPAAAGAADAAAAAGL